MFHCRFTPDDISGYTFDFLENYTSYIVAFENKDKYGNPVVNHYHILIDTDYGKQSVRNDIKASLKIPEGSGVRGKNNKYYSLIADWDDPGYICKWNDIRASKGYSEKQVMDYVISGQKKYLKKVETVELSGDSVAPAASSKTSKAKTQSVDRLVSTDALGWYNDYMIQNPHKEPTRRETIRYICDLYRKYGKGINKFKIRDAVHTLYYDLNSHRDEIIESIYSMI